MLVDHEVTAMPRARKSQLLPSLASACDELMRQIAEQVEVIVGRHRDEIAGELRALRRELSSAVRRVGRAGAPSARVGRPRSSRTCSVKDCLQAHVARGLCKNHYQQMRYVEKKAQAGQTVRRRRSSGALAPILDAARAHGAELASSGSTPRARPLRRRQAAVLESQPPAPVET
jgi:hypothetical protein